MSHYLNNKSCLFNAVVQLAFATVDLVYVKTGGKHFCLQISDFTFSLKTVHRASVHCHWKGLHFVCIDKESLQPV